MPPDSDGGSRITGTRRQKTSSPSPRPEALALLILGPDTDSGRELKAWVAAVTWLHALGLPAAVPAFPAKWMARHYGIRADWTVAS